MHLCRCMTFGTELARLEFYKCSGYCRGYLASAGDIPTPSAMVKRSSLANMVFKKLQQDGGALIALLD